VAWTTPHVFAVGEIITAATMNTYVSNNLSALGPVGSYMYLHQAATRVETTINGAWLECNGTAVSRSTYATLFAKISTAYGVGDGSTTFNIPDVAGRVLVALAGSGGNANVTALGGSDGVALANRRPQHRHTPHTHTINNSGTGTTTPSFSANRDVNMSASTGASDGGSGVSTDSLDAPAYLVAGIWSIKYLA
jgi:microcystin-dependent protein